jgi:hypothetical protein
MCIYIYIYIDTGAHTHTQYVVYINNILQTFHITSSFKHTIRASHICSAVGAGICAQSSRKCT